MMFGYYFQDYSLDASRCNVKLLIVIGGNTVSDKICGYLLAVSNVS